MSVNISIKLDGADKLTKALQGMPVQLRNALEVSVAKAAEHIGHHAKYYTPVDTGHLRDSIYQRSSGLTAEISTNINYAVYVHEGTRPHWIEPTSGYLWWKGAPHPMARVFHPGTYAVPFMKLGAREAESDIKNTVELEIERALSNL